MKFKNGDTVRVLNNNKTNRLYIITTPGSIGKIVSFTPNLIQVTIHFKEKDLTSGWGADYWYYCLASELSNFELVKSSPKTHLPDFL